MKKILFALSSLFLLGACVSMPTQEQQNVETKATLVANYDEVWKASMQAAMAQGYKLKIADKSSGVIQTETLLSTDYFSEQAMRKIAAIPSIFLATWTAYRYSIDIALNEKPDKTVDVNIKANVDGLNNINGWTICYTNGTLETKILNDIKGRLGK